MYLQQRAQCDLCLFKNLAKKVVQLQTDPGAGASSQERLGHRGKGQPSHLVSWAPRVSAAKQTFTATSLSPSSDLRAPAPSELRAFFFSRIALLFNFEYYFQWFLWGELRHEGLEQSLCWRIFSCSFDVISCCCSQIQLNCTIRRIPVCKLWNTVTAAIKSQHLINIATYHWLADTTVFALMQAENYSGVWYCTWIRLRTFKPPCNWTNEIKSPNPSMKKQNIHNLWTSLWTYEPCSNRAFSLDFKKI